MNDILSDFLHKFILRKFVTVYLHNVSVYIRTLDKHLDHLRLVLQRFKEDGLKLRLKSASSVSKRRSNWATLCQPVKFQIRQRKSKPLHTCKFLRRRRN
jgi:hypothetical protein